MPDHIASYAATLRTFSSLIEDYQTKHKEQLTDIPISYILNYFANAPVNLIVTTDPSQLKQRYLEQSKEEQARFQHADSAYDAIKEYCSDDEKQKLKFKGEYFVRLCCLKLNMTSDFVVQDQKAATEQLLKFISTINKPINKWQSEWAIILPSHQLLNTCLILDEKVSGKEVFDHIMARIFTDENKAKLVELQKAARVTTAVAATEKLLDTCENMHQKIASGEIQWDEKDVTGDLPPAPSAASIATTGSNSLYQTSKEDSNDAATPPSDEAHNMVPQM